MHDVTIKKTFKTHTVVLRLQKYYTNNAIFLIKKTTPKSLGNVQISSGNSTI